MWTRLNIENNFISKDLKVVYGKSWVGLLIHLKYKNKVVFENLKISNLINLNSLFLINQGNFFGISSGLIDDSSLNKNLFEILINNNVSIRDIKFTKCFFTNTDNDDYSILSFRNRNFVLIENCQHK